MFFPFQYQWGSEEEKSYGEWKMDVYIQLREYSLNGGSIETHLILSERDCLSHSIGITKIFEKSGQILSHSLKHILI